MHYILHGKSLFYFAYKGISHVQSENKQYSDIFLEETLQCNKSVSILHKYPRRLEL